MIYRNRLNPSTIVLALAAAAGAVQVRADVPHINPGAVLEHIKYLASDELEGRGDGSAGLEKAGDYIARHFRSVGLEPGGERGSFFQSFEAVTGLSLGRGNAVTIKGPRGVVAFEIGRDYELLSVSRDRSEEKPTPIVFAGYGISAPSLHYDDYAGLDVAGKAVLIFTHEPQENYSNSPFDGQTNTSNSTVMRKAEVAKLHGAREVLLVDDLNHPAQTDLFRRWMQEPDAEDYGLPVFYLSRYDVQRAFGDAFDLTTASRQIDQDLTPHSVALAGVSAVAVDRTSKIRRSIRNVIGVLPGHDPARARETVVIGAHYDHLGRSGRFSLAPDGVGQIHHGADDNASGTAAVLEMARAAAAARTDFARTLVFMTFAGEEIGLLGSSYYVQHPTLPLEHTVAMVNLDMVGRPGDRILVSGLDSSPSVDKDLEAASAGAGISLQVLHGGPGVGASDDTSFLLRRIPAFFFFNGLHADYHRPTDTWEKIQPAGAASVADLALALVRQIANRAERPEFIPPPPPPDHGTSTGDVSGYGPYFGSVPDFSNDGNGVKFADVRDGSPAAKAGIKRGDILVSFRGKPIKTLYDFTFALRQSKPGDRVEVIVLRGNQKIAASVELTNRP